MEAAYDKPISSYFLALSLGEKANLFAAHFVFRFQAAFMS